MSDAAREPHLVLRGADGSEEAVTTHATTIPRQQILSTGAECTLTVLAVFPLGQNDSTGQPASGLVLTVQAPGMADWLARIGIAIPPSQEARVVVGAKLPGKYLHDTGQPDDDNLVCPVW